MSKHNSGYLTECIKYQKVLYSPLKKQGYLPENGSEVFIRQIPQEDTEYDLLKFFQSVGDVFQVRLMVNEDGITNRGFGYVTYFDAASATKAVTTFKHVPYRGKHFLNVENSLNNCRIFVGGIPTCKRKDQVWQELYSKGVKNIVDVIMYRSYSNRSENRGFVFVEFRTHEEAAYFRVKYGKNLKLWDNLVVVDWSVPVPLVDNAQMNNVKIVYLRNLNVCQSREDIYAITLKFMPQSSIEKIYKFKNYAFVHLISRQYAERLMTCLKDYYKDTIVEVAWANPPNKYTSIEYRHNKVNQLFTNLPSTKYSSRSSSISNSPSFCSSCYKSLQHTSRSETPLSQNETFSPIGPISMMYRQKNLADITSESSSTYDSFNKELAVVLEDIQSAKTFCNKYKRYEDNPDSRPGKHYFDYLKDPTHSVTMSLPTLTASVESPPIEPCSGLPDEDPIVFYQKRMQQFYGNEDVLLLNDLNIVPRDIALEDLMQFIGDIF